MRCAVATAWVGFGRWCWSPSLASWSVAGGLLSILFGGLLIGLPQAGSITLVWIIGFYAVAFGVLFVLLAFRLRKPGGEMGTFA